MAKTNSQYMSSTAVINIAGLSLSILKRIPSLAKFSQTHSCRLIEPVFPALTCSAQSTYLTGLLPSSHGIVGNGWYFHDLSQVWLWRQSNRLVSGEKLWETAKRENPEFRCANLFWWYNMYSTVDYSVTPRPIYRSDGLKLPDISTEPANLRETLQKSQGMFPLLQFWGPGADIRSSEWISQASQSVFEKYQPTLSLIYLPHLDYCLQREGPNGPSVAKEVIELDRVCQNLIQFFKDRQTQTVILSEYGINEVKRSIPINKILRKNGWLKVKNECGEDHLDPGLSPAFAVADHQIAHIYVQNPSIIQKIRSQLEKTSGIEAILDKKEQIKYGIEHQRSGDLVLISTMDHWFSYSFWLEDKRAPDFARTVEIHKKPGYDPVELFIDPKIRFPKLKVIQTLVRKKLGFRYLMDIIPLDESLVRGSHGRSTVPQDYWPLFMTERSDLLMPTHPSLLATDLKSLLLKHVFVPTRQWSERR